MQRMTASLLVTMALGALAVASMAPAHATPPAILCGYECLWPIGSSEVPGSAEVGREFALSYTYAWEEIPGNAAIGTLDEREAPAGHRPWPDGWGAPERPDGYLGSTVELLLPDGIDVVGWESLGLERSEAWTDLYGRTTYRYAGTNAYVAAGASSAEIRLIVRPDAKIYPNDEVHIDLGVRGKAPLGPTIFVNRDGDSVSMTAKRVAEASGSGADPYSNRHVHVLPPSAVAPLGEDGLGSSARRGLVEFLVGQAEAGAAIGESDVPEFSRAQVMGRVGGAQGASGGEEITYVYGYLRAEDRGGAIEAATGVKVCMRDRVDSLGNVAPILVGSQPACTVVDDEGFFGIAVGRADTDGGMTGADIVPFFRLEHEVVRVTTDTRPLGIEIAGRTHWNVDALTLNMGAYTIADVGGFKLMRWAYSDVLDAHAHFKEELGYDVPPVVIHLHGQRLVVYTDNVIRIYGIASTDFIPSRHTILHEYGHHVMESAYDNGRPYAAGCVVHSSTTITNDVCAWVEGWADFAAALVVDSPMLSYAAGGTDSHINLETREDYTRTTTGRYDPLTGSLRIEEFAAGDASEGSVAAILWDIYDAGEEAGDDVHGDLEGLWATFMDAEEEGERYPATTVREFYDDWSDGGLQNLDGVFALNGVEPSNPFVPPSLSLSVERGGVARAGEGATHARAGDAVVARLDLGRAAPAGEDPQASMLGEARAGMTAVGEGRREWVARGTVGEGAHGGPASVTVHAVGARIALARESPIGHTDGASTVTLGLSGQPLVGSHAVTARAAIADSGGATMGSDRTLEFLWDPAVPRLVDAGISPDGRTLTYTFSEGLDARHVNARTILEGAALRTQGLAITDDSIDHVHGSSVVRAELSGQPRDGVYYVGYFRVVDLQGHVGGSGSASFFWDAREPYLVRATISSDGRQVDLEFSEGVHSGTATRSNISLPDGLVLADNDPITHSAGSDTITLRLASVPPDGTYEVGVNRIVDAGVVVVRSQVREFTWSAAAPTLKSADVSEDGRTVTLAFSEGLDTDTVTAANIGLPTGLSLDGADAIGHEDGSDTVTLRLAGAPNADGEYAIMAKRGITGSGGIALGRDQSQVVLWNPDPPALESIAVSPDGRALTVSFNEALDRARLLPHTLDMLSPSLADSFDSVTAQPGSGTLSVALEYAMTEGEHFVSTSPVIRHVADAAGRQAPASQTIRFAWDAAPPALESARVSSSGTELTLEFSEGLDTDTVTAANIGLPAGVSLAGAGAIGHEDGSDTVTLRLASAPGQGTHAVTAKSGIRDTTGIALGSDQQRSFTWKPGAPALDSAAISTDGRTVTLEFSESLDTDTVTAANIALPTSSVPLLITQRAASRAVTVDTEAPRLLDAAFVSTTEARLEFSERLDAATVVPSEFGVAPAAGAAPTVTSAGVDGRAVVLRLSPAAAAGTEHTISAGAGLADRAGNALPPSSRAASPPAAANDAPGFRAHWPTGSRAILTFSEDVRLIAGQELDWRDWLYSDGFGYEDRPAGHHVDLDNRRITLGFEANRQSRSGTITFSPWAGDAAKLEDLGGLDVPVGAAESGAGPITMDTVFAEVVSAGVLRVEFGADVGFSEGAPRRNGVTHATDWRVNGVAATGVYREAGGTASASVTLEVDTGLYLAHGAADDGTALQVEWVGPTSSPENRLTMKPSSATAVDRRPNAFTAGEFTGSRTLVLSAAKAIDARTAEHLELAGSRIRVADYAISAGPDRVTLGLGSDVRDGCEYSVGLRRPLSGGASFWTTAGSGSVTYADLHAPVILSASTDGTKTRVRFNEPVSFGASPTLEQHRGHWAISDGASLVAITSVRVVADDVTVPENVGRVMIPGAGEASVVELSHAPLGSTGATPTVTYSAGGDDDARVRDTRASECTEADAPEKNSPTGTLEVMASDAAAPTASVSASVSGNGVPKSGPNAMWAGIGDTVTVSVAMSEDARPGDAPRITADGENTVMEMGATLRAWSDSRTVEAGSAEGTYAFTVTTLDRAENPGVFTHGDAPAPVMVDTMRPEVASAETVSAGETRVTLTEGAWGLVRARDWAVGGVPAGAASAAGGEFAQVVALSGGTAFTLRHSELSDTGSTPDVSYRPQGTPGAAADPGLSRDPASPAPPPSGITLDVSGLDGATVRLGESRGFGVSVTVADGGHAIVRLDGNPDFVTVRDAPGGATVTVDASRGSATAGEHAFTVTAAAGSDPVSAIVTIRVVP